MLIRPEAAIGGLGALPGTFLPELLVRSPKLTVRLLQLGALVETGACLRALVTPDFRLASETFF